MAGHTTQMAAGVKKLPIFDLDGTLVDSDAALAAPFVALGVPQEQVTFGHVLADECQRLGVDVSTYLALYDPSAVRPFPGVEGLVGGLRRWAVCSNKHPDAGRAELAHFDWRPDVAMFADAFDGSKQLSPVLAALGAAPDEVVFIGDTDHDRECATAVGCAFALAGWNPRATPRRGDVVLRQPLEVLGLL